MCNPLITLTTVSHCIVQVKKNRLRHIFNKKKNKETKRGKVFSNSPRKGVTAFPYDPASFERYNLKRVKTKNVNSKWHPRCGGIRPKIQDLKPYYTSLKHRCQVKKSFGRSRVSSRIIYPEIINRCYSTINLCLMAHETTYRVMYAASFMRQFSLRT